jgi:phospholipid/cholesterol/gamma-HCH transport system substrate-binding protein
MTVALKFVHKIVILLIIIFAIAGLYWSYNNFGKQSKYLIVLDKPVKRLKVNAPVEFNGVEVGKITRISFDRHNPLKINIFVRIAKATPISDATRASFEDAPIISLQDEGKNTTPLKAKKNQRYPTISLLESSSNIIATSTSPIDKISNDVQQTREILQNLLSDDNVELLKQLMYSIQSVTAVLSTDKEKISSLLLRTEAASTEFKPFLEAGKETAFMLKAQTLPQLNQLSENLNDTLSDLRELIVTIKRNPSILVRGSDTPALGPGEKLQYFQSKAQRIEK